MSTTTARLAVPIPLVKLEATGNDFLILDSAEVATENLDRAALARAACDRHFGIGADGLIVLLKTGADQWQWDFRNNDGSEAEMCGNASRCVGRYLAKRYGVDQAKLQTRIGVVHLRSNEQGVTSSMNAISAKALQVEKDLFFVEAGVPHYIIVVPEVSSAVKSQLDRIKNLRQSSQHSALGANVTLLKLTGDVVTFERGVEDFTLSCGTGMIVAAAVLRHINAEHTKTRYQLSAPGGRTEVEFVGESVELHGPANLIGFIQFLKET